MNIDPDLFTAPDLSGIIDNYILDGAISKAEFPDLWKGQLERFVSFPFRAKYKSKKKMYSVEVLRFKYFKYNHRYGDLLAYVEVKELATGKLKRLKLEQIKHPQADVWTQRMIRLWHYWKNKY